MSSIQTTVMQWLLVGAGGFVGSVLRFAVSGLTYRLAPFTGFPWGTLVVNGLGCLVIGWLGGAADSRGVLEPGTRLFVMIGVLGGFTTFSTFSYETLALLRDGDQLRAGLNIALSLIICLTAVWAGHQLGSVS